MDKRGFIKGLWLLQAEETISMSKWRTLVFKTETEEMFKESKKRKKLWTRPSVICKHLCWEWRAGLRGLEERCLVWVFSWSVLSDSLRPYCGPPGFFAHGILQVRILEWVAITFSRGSSWPRGRTWVSILQADSLPLSRWGSPERCLQGPKERRPGWISSRSSLKLGELGRRTYLLGISERGPIHWTCSPGQSQEQFPYFYF